MANKWDDRSSFSVGKILSHSCESDTSFKDEKHFNFNLPTKNSLFIKMVTGQDINIVGWVKLWQKNPRGRIVPGYTKRKFQIERLWPRNYPSKKYTVFQVGIIR